LLERGARLFGESRFEEAADDFRRATEYPASLGVGKLHDSSDAQAYYLLGLALEKLGRDAETRQAWESAADGMPVRGSEQAFYVGRSREQLGRSGAEEAFEKILPSERPADSEYARARHAYLLGLHCLANGREDEATGQLSAAREIESSDSVKMHRHLEEVFYTRSEGRRVPISVWWAVEPEMARAATH
jgi:tetratricopeptide (TPR) repeat protein